jgi:hypothetical protein
MRSLLLLLFVSTTFACRSFTSPEEGVLNERRFGPLATVAMDEDARLVLIDQKSGRMVTAPIAEELEGGRSQGALLFRDGAHRLAEAAFNGTLAEERYSELFDGLLGVCAELVRVELELGAWDAERDSECREAEGSEVDEECEVEEFFFEVEEEERDDEPVLAPSVRLRVRSIT